MKTRVSDREARVGVGGKEVGCEATVDIRGVTGVDWHATLMKSVSRHNQLQTFFMRLFSLPPFKHTQCSYSIPATGFARCSISKPAYTRLSFFMGLCARSLSRYPIGSDPSGDQADLHNNTGNKTALRSHETQSDHLRVVKKERHDGIDDEIQPPVAKNHQPDNDAGAAITTE